MSEIITLEKQKQEQCMSEINVVLKKYNMAMSPVVKITLTGMQFSINLVDASQKAVHSG